MPDQNHTAKVLENVLIGSIKDATSATASTIEDLSLQLSTSFAMVYLVLEGPYWLTKPPAAFKSFRLLISTTPLERGYVYDLPSLPWSRAEAAVLGASTWLSLP